MNRTDPDSAAIWRSKLDMAIEDFQHRRITDDVFRALLHSAGFRGVRLSEEFNFHNAVRYGIEEHETFNGRIKHGD